MQELIFGVIIIPLCALSVILAGVVWAEKRKK